MVEDKQFCFVLCSSCKKECLCYTASMISLDEFSSDLVAIVQAGCSIQFDLDNRNGYKRLWITVRPGGTPRESKDELAEVCNGGVPSSPLMGQADLYDPLPELSQFFKDARVFLGITA